MPDNKRILVIVDPTMEDDDQASIERGVWLDSKLGLGLNLLICDYEQYLSGGGARFFDTPGLPQLRRNAIDFNRKRLEAIAEPLRSAGHDVIVSSVWDAPLDEGITRHIMRTGPSFVIKETHYHSKIDRTLFSNTDWNLVRQCPKPLWLAKDKKWPANATILASVDPAHHDDKHAGLDNEILGPATLLADKLNCELHAFHAFVPMSTLAIGDGAVAMGVDIDEKLEEAHRREVDNLLADLDFKKEHVHVLPGQPDQLLPKLADELHAGLIVMGSIARNALQKIFIGSTAEKTLFKLPCDLLVVKPTWFKSDVSKTPSAFSEGSTDIK